MNPKDLHDDLIEIKADKIPNDDRDIIISEEKEINAVSEEIVESDDFSAELAEMEEESRDTELLDEISDSIKMQVENDIAIESDVSIEEDLLFNTQSFEFEQTASKEEKNFFVRFVRKVPLWAWIVTGVAVVIIGFFIWLTCSSAGQALLIKIGSHYASGKVNYRPVEQEPTVDIPDDVDEELIPDIPVISNDETVVTPNPEESTPVPDNPEENLKHIYNVLLIGEENTDQTLYRGRSDTIIVATLDMRKGTVKLTSIMRDLLVSIPGYSDNRINAAFSIGGVSMLYKTLKQNLNIEFDNYVLVNFSAFEKIIDELGGIDVELSAKEADYLNTTNYISDEQSRNVVAGINHFNGSQALGYCRIRKVPTLNGEDADFGRTKRQRDVLGKLFEKVKNLGYLDMFNVADKCLPYVTTDITSEQMEMYVKKLVEIGSSANVENFRIPVSGSFGEAYIRNMLVTKADIVLNAEELKKFIYGEER